jgi:hypothetical protein
MALAPATQIGPYRIEALLGTGGMGEVYRAHDTRLDRTVAMKVLPADKLADEERKRRFLQEAKSASALNHPHIVTIYEIESANGAEFLVMEFVPGKTLERVIPKKGLRLNEALRYAIQIADALAAAHAAGIVHRDLKPGQGHGDTERNGKAARFRAREADGTRSGGRGRWDRDGDGSRTENNGRHHLRYCFLHESGAGGSKSGGCAQRHLQLRLRTV